MTETAPETAEAEPRQWEMVGLGGARWIVTFPSAAATAAAASALILDEHGHHFAVVGEGQKIIMSKHATQCLIREFGPTGQPGDG